MSAGRTFSFPDSTNIFLSTHSFNRFTLDTRSSISRVSASNFVSFVLDNVSSTELNPLSAFPSCPMIKITIDWRSLSEWGLAPRVRLHRQSIKATFPVKKGQEAEPANLLALSPETVFGANKYRQLIQQKD